MVSVWRPLATRMRERERRPLQFGIDRDGGRKLVAVERGFIQDELVGIQDDGGSGRSDIDCDPHSRAKGQMGGVGDHGEVVMYRHYAGRVAVRVQRARRMSPSV